MIADGSASECTSARVAHRSVGFGTRQTHPESETEQTQVKRAQCATNSGGPMASGACVTSVHELAVSRRGLGANWTDDALGNAAAVTPRKPSRVPSDALRVEDEMR